MGEDAAQFEEAVTATTTKSVVGFVKFAVDPIDDGFENLNARLLKALDFLGNLSHVVCKELVND